jgi:hypothetical protein
LLAAGLRAVVFLAGALTGARAIGARLAGAFATALGAALAAALTGALAAVAFGAALTGALATATGARTKTIFAFDFGVDLAISNLLMRSESARTFKSMSIFEDFVDKYLSLGLSPRLNLDCMLQEKLIF